MTSTTATSCSEFSKSPPPPTVGGGVGGEGRLPPDLPGGAHDEIQLAVLLIGREGVAHQRRREAALGAERQVVEVDVFRRLLDALTENRGRLQRAGLRRHQ